MGRSEGQTRGTRRALRRFDRLGVRLALIGTIPLLTLTVLGAREVARQRALADEARQASEAIDNLRYVSDLRVNLEVEALFALEMTRFAEFDIDADALDVASALGFDLAALQDDARRSVDQDLEDLRNNATPHISHELTTALADIEENRDRVDRQDVTPDEVTEMYAAALAAVDECQVDQISRIGTGGKGGVDIGTYDALVDMLTEGSEAVRLTADQFFVVTFGGTASSREDFVAAIARTDYAEERLLDTLDLQTRARYEQMLASLPTSRAEASQRILEALAPGATQLDALGAVDDLAAFYEAVNRADDFLPVLGQRLADVARTQRVEAEADARQTTILLAATALVTVATLAAGIGSITRPIRRLGATAASVRDGVLPSEPLPLQGPDEVSTATATFNQMTETIEVIELQARALADGRLDDDSLQTRVPGNLGDSLHLAVTRLAESTTRLHREATTDHLTGLPNRAAIMADLEGLLASPSGTPIALLFVDVDRFKQVNDIHGHGAGDALLRQLAERLSAAACEACRPARLGGDEFVAVVIGEDALESARSYAQRIVASVGEPITLEHCQLAVSVSIGIAVARPDAPVERLLSEASAAMRTAKRTRASIVEYDDSLRRSHVARNQILRGIETAIDDDHLELYVQPILDTERDEVVSVEALVRWRPGDRVVTAAEFITIAEESGLIERIDEWVLDSACRTLARWHERYRGAEPAVAVNVSAGTLLRADFVHSVAAALHRTGAEARRLCLELTETQLLGDVDRAVNALARVRDLGVSVALDDFGTGHASLNYLRRLPADYVKIDRSFVALLPDAADQSIIEMIAGLASQLDLDVVAEGVESELQFEVLQRLGCTLMQGYLYAPPMAVDDFETWWAARSPNPQLPTVNA